ncbi:MAG: hypothetical protein QOK42_1711 [Frankiaceae bacterium]|jgi:hypothetical protein|nr:hypothetical protein [Frankiaceae bacterium]
MTDHFDHERWEELAVAHALDALEPSEDVSFLEHLASCARCRRVVDDVLATATDLALAVDPSDPSPEFRASLLDAVAYTPQVRQTPAARQELPVQPQLAPPAPRASTEPPGFVRWLVGAAAAIALVMGIGFVATYDGSRAPVDSRVAQAFGRCLDDNGCTPIRLLGSDGTVLAAVLVRGNRAELVSERLAPNPAASTTYVLWAQHTAGPVRAVGVFDVTSRGESVHELDALPWKISEISAFMVSREAGNVAPASGSAPVAQGTV